MDRIAAEERADDRQISQHGNAVRRRVRRRLEQSRDRERLAFLEPYNRTGASLIDRGNLSSVHRRSAGEIELAEHGLNVELDDVVGENLGKELEDRSERRELDGDDRGSTWNRRALRDGIRELPSRQELSGLTVERHQVGLGEEFGELVRSERVEKEREHARVEDSEELRRSRREVSTRAEARRIADSEGVVRASSDDRRLDRSVVVGDAHRSAVGPADRRTQHRLITRIKPAYADLTQRGPIELGDLHLEHHLPWPGNMNAIDDKFGEHLRGVDRGGAHHPSRASHHAAAGHSAGAAGAAAGASHRSGSRGDRPGRRRQAKFTHN